ncbi:MAG: M23 family metallopeptidase [Gammaproteobacteria bacterium]|nr:M23 family metallopeptidase [Gammaproteobacteria bacterium]
MFIINWPYLSRNKIVKKICIVSALILLSACGGGGSGGDDDEAAGSAVPFFDKPFDANFPVSNLFDHDVPLQFVDINGYTVDHNGIQRNIGVPGAYVDGHSGHDWLLPTGTALKSVADGEVVFAGIEMFVCPALPGSPVVNQKDVRVEHTASNGDFYLSRYTHVDTIAVTVGDMVNSGQNLATSGNTGCSTAPHLHFQVYRWSPSHNAWITVDPYGWAAATQDSWAQHPNGTASVPLWKAGQAPTLVLQ